MFAFVWDYLLEGACAGAQREIAIADAPVLVEAYKRLEDATLEAAKAAGAGAQLRRLLAATRLQAVALGYWSLRGSFGASLVSSIDVLEAVGKEKPAIKVAVLALSELGHSTAAIATGLNIDSALVRRVRASYAAKI